MDSFEASKAVDLPAVLKDYLNSEGLTLIWPLTLKHRGPVSVLRVKSSAAVFFH